MLASQEDYRRMLAEGKSFVVIGGDEKTRIKYANRMKELGASEIFQHPLVLQVVRDPESEQGETEKINM